MAEYYSVELSQKVKCGLKINAEKCLCTGGTPTLGYDTDENKKAPAGAKAVEENYILTTKLFYCRCQVVMVGVSGTSHTGAIHQYYQCNTEIRKENCDKKTAKDTGIFVGCRGTF